MNKLRALIALVLAAAFAVSGCSATGSASGGVSGSGSVMDDDHHH